MSKVRFFNKYPTNIDIDTDKDVEVYIDEFNTTPVPVGSIRIVILEESLKGSLVSLASDYKDAYTYLLTYHQELLNNNPKAILFHSTINSWIQRYIFPQKNFCVSALIGGKENPAQKGYALRHELWWNKDRITIPKDFYLSSACRWKELDSKYFSKNSKSQPDDFSVTQEKAMESLGCEVNYNGQKILGYSKNPLFDSQFHIAIENTKIANYFSEKLLDCFQTKTIPIYYGCLNTHEYFNTEGIFFVDNIEDIISYCNTLTPETYEKMLPFAEDNFLRSEKWKDCTGRVENMVKELIK